MFKFIRDWQDRRLKKRMERIFCSYVLDCDIDVKGCVSALGAKEIAWWRIDGKKNPLPPEWQEGTTPKMITDINHKNESNMKNFKSIAFFLILAIIAFGLICGIGFCAYSGQYLYTGALVVVAIACVPTAKMVWKKMWEE